MSAPNERAAATSRQAVEDRTRSWLESSILGSIRALRGREGIVYDSTGRPCAMSRHHFQEVLRKLKIFRWLDRQRFASFLDVGSGIDIYPTLVASRHGASAYFSDLTHRMNLPYGGALFGKLDHAVTLNLARLPFPDRAFDVVLASEVLEHLVRPLEAIAELLRVTRRILVMTSLEALAVNRRERLWSHHRVDVRVPHVERNFFLLDEFAAIFGPGLRHENLLYDPDLPASGFANEEEQRAAYAAIDSVAAFEAALLKAIAVTDHRPGAMGIVIVEPRPGVLLAPPEPATDGALARWLIDRVAWGERTALEMLRQDEGEQFSGVAPDRPVARELLALLRCPDCGGDLHSASPGLACAACGTRFAAEYGVPVLYPTRERDPVAGEEEALARLCGDDGARRRVVRAMMARLRRNERPPGRLRRLAWRLEDRVRRTRSA